MDSLLKKSGHQYNSAENEPHRELATSLNITLKYLNSCAMVNKN